MDVYYSPEAIESLQALALLVTAQNADGLIIGHERGPSFFVERVMATKRGFFPSLEKFYAVNDLLKGTVIGFYTFKPEKKKTEKILAPFAMGKLFLELYSSKSKGLELKPFRVEYDNKFYLSPLKRETIKDSR